MKKHFLYLLFATSVLVSCNNETELEMEEETIPNISNDEYYIKVLDKQNVSRSVYDEIKKQLEYPLLANNIPRDLLDGVISEQEVRNEIEDITVHIKKLESSSFLTAKQLLDLANILKISRKLKEYFN